MSQHKLRVGIFHVVAAHLLKQGARSVYEGNCAYRGENGKSCAVGCLISDEQYDEAFEGSNMNVPDVKRAVALSIGRDELNAETSKMLSELQDLHDWSEPSGWAGRLRKIADQYNIGPVEGL